MMNLKKKLCILILSLITVFSFGAAFFNPKTEMLAEEERGLEDIIGVTTAGAYYEFNPMVSNLEDGANRVYELGSRVVKLWLSTSSMGTSYAFNVDWEKYGISNCVDLLNSEPYRNALSKDFSTVVFEAHTFDYDKSIKEVVWNDGMTEDEYSRIKSEIYQIAKYLLREYNGTGKTFVLQNWEGDNMLGTNFVRKSERGYYYDTRQNTANEANEETDTEIKLKLKGFTDWMNARQDGVDQAVKEAGKFTDVKVLNAMEVNFIYIEGVDSAPYPYPDSPVLLDSVVPYTNCDLYSYSNWQSAYMYKVDSLNDRLKQYHDKIGDTYTDSEGVVQQRRPMSREGQRTKVMLGEYGSAEYFQPNGSSFADELNEETDRLHYSVIRAETEIALDFGCEYILVWQLYCNELKQDNTVNIAIGEQAYDPSLMRGYWLIRPDGSYTSAYRYLEGLFNKDNLLYEGEASQSGVKIDGVANQVVVSAVKNSQEAPKNNSELYEDDVKLYGSANGDSYSEISLYSYNTTVEQTTDGYKYRVNYVSTADVSAFKYFKTETITEGVEVNQMQVYPMLKENLLRVKMSGQKEGETEKKYLSSYVLSSGEKIKLAPEFNRAFFGNVTYVSTNRYIAEVNQNGEVTGKVNGSVDIIVTISGEGIDGDLQFEIGVTVMALGEELLHDSFIGYKTISYENDNAKKPGTELAGFGSVVFDDGVTAKYFEQFNMHFYRLDVENDRTELAFFKDVFGNTSIGYILDWNKYGYCYVTYQTEKDIGGYAIELNTYGMNALSSLQVYVSEDNENWVAVSSSINDSRAIGLGYFYNKIVNRQILPTGMRFIRIRLSYVDSNRWNPQMYDVKIYGEPEIAAPEYVDSEKPVLQIDGTIQESVYLGETISIPQAQVTDNYAVKSELEETYMVKAYYFMDGSFFEVGIDDDKVSLTVEAIYKIEYSVYDLAGNRSVKNFYVQSILPPDEEPKELSFCASVVLGNSIAVLLIGIGVTTFIIYRKRKVK